MKSYSRLALVAALALCTTACVRLNTPQKKAGYAVGQQIGQNLERLKGKVDLAQLDKGLSDEAAGTATLKDEALAQILGQLGGGQTVDPAQAGYAVGVSLGRNLKGILPYADLAMIEQGLKDEFKGKDRQSDADNSQALQDMEQRRAVADEAAGEAFLAKNKTQPGVTVTASGLQYQVLRPGHGRHPKATDTVTVNYLGTLIDGTVFDSSYARHKPATFPLNRVIPGWTEGLQLMRVGAEYRFVIPSNLAYGQSGQGGAIGPNSVLIFQVELLSIQGH